MIRRLILLVGLLSAASCASLPPDCRQINSERGRVEHSWLVKQLPPSALRADVPKQAELLKRYQDGDQIWRYRAPETPQAYPDTIARTAYDGYVLLRGCEAVHVIRSNGF